MKTPSSCPHFSLCSGCTLGGSYSPPPLWARARAFFQVHAPHIEPKWNNAFFEQSRYKAKLAVRAGPEIGLFKKRSHEVASIPNCLVHHPAINEAVSQIKEELIRSQLPLYTENPPSGWLRYLQLFVERETNRIQLALIVNAAQANRQLEDFCSQLNKIHDWHSIWLNFQPDASNLILGESWNLMQGEPFLWQTLNNIPIAFHPGAFSQSNLPLFEQMIKKIDSWIKPHQKITEFYAGVGAIGLSLLPKASHLHLVENNPYSHLSFLETVKRLESNKCIYECLSVNEISLSETDVIIVDPPRKGLDASLLKQLCSLNDKTLIYISCGFDSFERDAKQLIAAGWKFQDIEGYLFFPGTDHIEIAALLT